MIYKFRAWDIQRKFMIYDFDELDTAGDFHKLNDVFRDKNYIFMLCTGFKDAFKNDIWEGDTVLYSTGMNQDAEYKKKYSTKKTVVLENGEFKNCKPLAITGMDRIEVIGNIYEGDQ